MKDLQNIVSLCLICKTNTYQFKTDDKGEQFPLRTIPDHRMAILFTIFTWCASLEARGDFLWLCHCVFHKQIKMFLILSSPLYSQNYTVICSENCSVLVQSIRKQWELKQHKNCTTFGTFAMIVSIPGVKRSKDYSRPAMIIRDVT